MNPTELIEIRPEVMRGKPCFARTRIPVSLVLDKLSAGETAEQLLAAYPQLTEEHIRAALKNSAEIAT